MYVIVTVLVIIGSLLIVGFAYNFLIENQIIVFSEHDPIAGILPLLLLSGIASIIFSIILGVTIIRPMKSFQEAFLVVSEGDLDYRLQLNTRVNEVADMRNAFNKMVEDLSLIETLSNDFIANVSHEFKTPLSTIEAYAVLLQDENLDEDKRIEYINTIRTNAQELSLLTDNILKLSRLENNAFENNKTEYRLDEQVRNVILLNEKTWSKKNIEFDLNLQTIMYNGNKNILSQVWQNLIDNAIKFSYPNGKITISLVEEDQDVIFSIQDYGEGIAKEDIQRIFDKFYQGDTSRKSYGNGLGLSLVNRIIEIHEGQLLIDSKQKEGTTIKIILPQSLTSH